MKVLFVCLGNICRSPTAEGVFRSLAEEAGVGVEVDSAGTGAWHEGEPPDRRMRAAAQRRGYLLDGRARRIEVEDFFRFDVVVAMDRSNYQDIQALRPSNARARLVLFRDFDPTAPGMDTPDPYYGGPEGFDEVVRIVERTGRSILEAHRAGRLP
ncbi:MAG: low molecular weight protein-tyrosine-phosphatase [Myxococcota bacterium]